MELIDLFKEFILDSLNLFNENADLFSSDKQRLVYNLDEEWFGENTFIIERTKAGTPTGDKIKIEISIME